ncbi:fibroblast growth factor 19 [Thomomys bottae]
MRSATRALVLASLWLAAAGRPLAPSDQGPHLYYRWDQPVRLRHLYAAGPYGRSNCFLRILDDGSVLCDRHRGQYGLLEIRAVSLQTVSIKDVRSVRYLCMDADGRMQGLVHFLEEDCAFKEEIGYLGYNVYWSPSHQRPVTLSSARQRSQARPSYFLPLLPQASAEDSAPLEPALSLPLEPDSMDPFGMASELGLVRSPSFQK